MPGLMFACFLNPKLKEMKVNSNSSISDSSVSLFNQTVGKTNKTSQDNKVINKYPSYTIMEPTSPLQVSNLGMLKSFLILYIH
jgi:hypothetical protein